MRQLFEIDLQDYENDYQVFKRPSARAVILKGRKIALVYSQKEKYYKFPGGGIKEHEDKLVALIREVKEEVGLIVKPETIVEFGSVMRRQKSNISVNTIFEQENFYYVCECEDCIVEQKLDEYERTAELVLRYVDIDEAIRVNAEYRSEDFFNEIMIKRERKVLEIIKNERKPKMILFDYGQTLVDEQRFDGVKGTEAVLAHATKNKYNKSAEEVQSYANMLNQELGRFDPEKGHLFQVEIPNHMFRNYLYESQGIEIALSSEELDSVFWDAAAPGVPTKGIVELLAFCKKNHIRTGVISNITYCGSAVKKRINDYIPENEFEFIIATSEYMYRKPNRRIFELALEKADLKPEDVWYVGDQYQCDIVGAKGAGLFPIWYTGAIDMNYEAREDVLTIREWTELINLLS